MWQKLKKKKKGNQERGKLFHTTIYTQPLISISTSALHLCELLMQQDEQLDENKSESKDKRRWNGKGKKRGGTKCKREETRVSEESCHARGAVPVLNISITDWAAMKMLLIQTPKDFYKTSISLSWLQHSGIHQGSKSKKICVRARKKLFTLRGSSLRELSWLWCWNQFPPLALHCASPQILKHKRLKHGMSDFFFVRGNLRVV